MSRSRAGTRSAVSSTTPLARRRASSTGPQGPDERRLAAIFRNQALFDALAGEDVHRCVSGITLPNPSSVALHRRCGFRSVGIFKEIGRKHGRYWDVQWFSKELN